MNSSTDSRKLWSFHVENGQRFLDEHMIALDGADLGDLSLLPDSKEAFRTKYAETRTGETGAALTGANLYYRLVHEMREGDYVALSWSAEVCLGVVEGEYAYTAGAGGCEHRRRVRWERQTNRGELHRAALRELDSSPVRLFAVLGDGGKFLSAMGKPPLKEAVKSRLAARADSKADPASPQGLPAGAETSLTGKPPLDGETAAGSGTLADTAFPVSEGQSVSSWTSGPGNWMPMVCGNSLWASCGPCGIRWNRPGNRREQTSPLTGMNWLPVCWYWCGGER